MAKELRKLKRFRFQLLHSWITENFTPSTTADIGGGKGLLAYLLNQDGYLTTVIDPFSQGLPNVYKDLSGKRHKLPATITVPRIDKEFTQEMAKDFDLLIGMHAHGSNMKIIDAATAYKKDFILLPCCVIDEPVIPQADINWLDSLEEYAQKKGHQVKRFELNFKGQNIGIYMKGTVNKKEPNSYQVPKRNLKEEMI